MIYFAATVRALEAHIDELQERLEASEAERKALLDRLLERNNYAPVGEARSVEPRPSQPLQVIAPPGVGPQDVQDAIKEVWIAEETTFQMEQHGYDEYKAAAEAERLYRQQFQVIQ